MLGTREKPGSGVDHKSVRVDAWLMVWARVLAMGFGGLIGRLLKRAAVARAIGCH